MRNLQRREQILLGLLVLAGLWMVVAKSGGGFGLGGGAPVTEALPPLAAEAPVVERDLLLVAAVEYDPGGRNLFQYYTPPKPKPAYTPPPAPPPRPPTPPPVVKQREPPKPAPTGPKAPTPSFRYIGTMGSKENKIAFFEDTEELMMAQLDEVITEPFKLVEFKFGSVVLGYTDARFKDETTELKQQGKQ